MSWRPGIVPQHCGTGGHHGHDTIQGVFSNLGKNYEVDVFVEEKLFDSQVAQEVLERVAPLARQGRPKKEAEEKGRDPYLNENRASPYIAARLKRDHPDIAAKVESGEIKTLHQAGIRAGFVKQRNRISLDGAWRIRAFCKLYTCGHFEVPGPVFSRGVFD